MRSLQVFHCLLAVAVVCILLIGARGQSIVKEPVCRDDGRACRRKAVWPLSFNHGSDESDMYANSFVLLMLQY